MAKAKLRIKQVKKPPEGIYNYDIFEPDHENKERGIRVKCPNCGVEKVLEDLGGWFYIILKHTFCEVCGTKIEMEGE